MIRLIIAGLLFALPAQAVEIRMEVEPQSVRDARLAQHNAEKAVRDAETAQREARKNIPNNPNPSAPVTWGDLNRVLDALRDSGIVR